MDWIATEFRRFGLRPGGDHGTYVQRYPIVYSAKVTDVGSLPVEKFYAIHARPTELLTMFFAASASAATIDSTSRYFATGESNE